MGTYNGNDPYVFVSYCHADSALVLPIIQGLQDRGFRVWYDEGIEVSVAWAKYVGERLERCSCVLAYVTNNYDDSHNCWQELDFAMEEKKQIVAIKLEGKHRLSAGMRMRLVSIQTMPFEKYGSVEKILETLSQAAVLKSCLRSSADSENYLELEAEKLYKQAEMLYDREECGSAFRTFYRSAMLGYAPALFKLGRFYNRGECVPRAYEEAARLFREAAKQEYVDAQYMLGECYYLGNGVPHNMEEAVKWYRKAAEQGDVKAQYSLGCCYDMSEDDQRNPEEAVKWYRKAAEQGHVTAQYFLGTCYESGDGVQKDMDEARKWYQKAADQGDEMAIEILKEL